jgi:hypothetical protein
MMMTSTGGVDAELRRLCHPNAMIRSGSHTELHHGIDNHTSKPTRWFLARKNCDRISRCYIDESRSRLASGHFLVKDNQANAENVRLRYLGHSNLDYKGLLQLLVIAI